jgi:large repetitive protein
VHVRTVRVLIVLALALAAVGVTATAAGATGGSVTGLSISATEGSIFGGAVATFVDPACGFPTYSATVDWGDGTQSSGAVTYYGTCAAGYNVVSSHTYAEEGTYSTSISVTGTDGFAGTGTGLATVADAPLTLTPSTVTFTAHKTFTTQVATITDTDPGAVASDFTATIDWGDGQHSAGTVAAGAQGGFAVSGTHAYKKPGSDTITVVADDVGGAQAGTQSPADSLLVTGLTIHATHGVLFGNNVAGFVDPLCPNNASFSATVSWGDGSKKTQDSVTFNGTCSAGYNVVGSHTYAAPGTFKLVVTVKATNGEGGKGKGSAIVS